MMPTFSYQFVRKVIENFNGNGEKFYPQFYEIVFRGLNKRCSVILGLEVANAVLTHLTGPCASDTLCSVDIQELGGKERNIVKYLSGYVFHTLYRRLRKAKYHNESSALHMSILLAGKSTLPETDSSTDDIFIDANNRGGLWKVIPQAMKIFLVVEKQFREHVGDDTRKIDIKSMVLTLLRNCQILSNFLTICGKSDIEIVDKEIAKNLLESLITLYLRARTFKFVSLKKEAFKLESKKKKLKSLRTSIKKASKDLESGH